MTDPVGIGGVASGVRREEEEERGGSIITGCGGDIAQFSLGRTVQHFLWPRNMFHGLLSVFCACRSTRMNEQSTY